MHILYEVSWQLVWQKLDAYVVSRQNGSSLGFRRKLINVIIGLFTVVFIILLSLSYYRGIRVHEVTQMFAATGVLLIHKILHFITS